METDGTDVVSIALVAVVGVLAIVLSEKLAPRLRVATPLVLVTLGVIVSFIPAVPAISVNPELILAGVLPPLLYASAVNLPAMEFRRDLTAIGALSVVLVIASSLTLGVVFSLVVPEISLPIGIALGAILSPTDAVATTIVRRLGVSPRIVTVLEGESLFNDATSLVIMGVAISAAGSTQPLALDAVLWTFVYSIVLALGVGALVGTGGLRFRRWLGNPVLSTLVSFTAPFLAYVVSEELGASGLVAVATTGLVTGTGAPNHLEPADRMAEAPTWRSLSLLLEGVVFLVMGLELFGLVQEVRDEHESLLIAIGIAALAVVVILVVRTLAIGALLALLGRRAHRQRRVRGAYDEMRADGGPALPARTRDGREVPPESVARLRRFVARATADLDYYLAEPLGPRQGVLLVWAGMRGVVTLAAAQSLPSDTPQRALLVLVAFAVAAGTLLLQGATLPAVVRRLGLTRDSSAEDLDRVSLRAELDAAADTFFHDPDLVRSTGVPFDPEVVARVRSDAARERAANAGRASDSPDLFAQYQELRLQAIEAQRRALGLARGTGRHSSRALRVALTQLDAEQIEIRSRRGPVVAAQDDQDDTAV